MTHIPHLGIFAKAPVPGHVKTRLAADIGDAAAAAWYEKSIAAVFALTTQTETEIHRVLFFDPPTAEQQFEELTAVPDQRIAQTDGDLGQRMHAAFWRLFELGASAAALVGTDTPTLPPSYIDDAWSALDEADVVIGPATDGGYYLIGLQQPREGLFRGIDWSTERVKEQTLELASEGGLRVHLLPEWQDVDTLQDLESLGPEWSTSEAEPR